MNELHPDLLTEAEAARHLGIGPSALAGRREAGTAPAHQRGANGRVYYWLEDLADHRALPPGRPRKADQLARTTAKPSRALPALAELRKPPKRRPHERGGRGGTRWTPRQRPDFLLTVTDERGLVNEHDANVYLGLNPRSGLLNRRRYGSATPPSLKIGRRYWYRPLDLLAFDPSLHFRETRNPNLAPVSYSATHQRIVGWRGSARLYACTADHGCQSTAEHWAYIGGCEDELIEQSGRERGSRYCAHPSHYRPLCRMHHAEFDQDPSRRRLGVDA